MYYRSKLIINLVSPSFSSSKNKEVLAVREEETNLECDAFGEPSPYYKWFRIPIGIEAHEGWDILDNEDLSNAEELANNFISNDDSFSEEKSSVFNDNDYNYVYFCTATNHYGSTRSGFIQLKVVSRPHVGEIVSHEVLHTYLHVYITPYNEDVDEARYETTIRNVKSDEFVGHDFTVSKEDDYDKITVKQLKASTSYEMVIIRKTDGLNSASDIRLEFTTSPPVEPDVPHIQGVGCDGPNICSVYWENGAANGRPITKSIVTVNKRILTGTNMDVTEEKVI